MKYFVDFEATQFSNEIIEIGCIREDGETFKSYVKADKKLTNFITNLTGITQDMVDNAPTSDEVFAQFYNWLRNDTEIEFYCYGNSDIDFVKRNLSKTVNFEAQAALSVIGMALNDYAITVKNHFGLIKPIGLVKVLAHYRGVESIDQGHDALEDAIFLKEVFEYISAEGEIEECPFPDYQKPKKVAVPIPVVTPGISHIARIRKNKVVEVYETMDACVNWVYQEVSKTNRDQVFHMRPENVAKRIRCANAQKKTYMTWKFKIYGNDKEVTSLSSDFTPSIFTEENLVEENMKGDNE